MKLILRYVKPFIPLVALALLLLFAQTILELNLPNYMSSIVNVGIVQSGISDAAPAVMDADTMDLTLRFLDSEEAARVRSGYTWVDAGGADAKTQKTYPELKTRGGYVRNKMDKADLAVLNDTVAKSYYILSIAGGGGFGLDFARLSLAEVKALAEGLSEESVAVGRAAAGSDDANAGFMRSVAVTLVKVIHADYGADVYKLQQNYILKIGGIMLLFSIMSGLCTVGNGFCGARVSAGIGKKLRHDVYERVTSYSSEDVDAFSTATLITRSTNDVQQIQMVAMMGIRMVFMAPITAVGGIVMALRKSVDMSWIVALAVVVLLALQVVMFKLVVPKFQIMQKLTDRLNLVARESLTGMLVIRAFGNEKLEEERFDIANKDITETGLFVQRTMATLNPIENFMLSAVTLLIIWVGGHLVAKFYMPVGDMMAYMQYVMQIIMAFLMIAQMFIMLPRALVAAGRVEEVLQREPTIRNRDNLKKLPGRAKGHIEFDHVSFKYGDAESNVLEDINLDIQPGQTVAFIGSTGSGKSTLINLVPRFYDVTEGCIRLDGVDIRDLDFHELRNNIGYVPQKGVLFSGDVATNMSLGKEDGTDEEMYRAIQTAQAGDFINEENNGLSIAIAQGGENVSGGQKQRLSIARALIKNPPIFIFDDSFSALDFRTDAALRKALYATTENATVLMVAQRVSTIMNADQIFVLEEGKIVGHGTHRELLESCEAYREIAESQLSKEELA